MLFATAAVAMHGTPPLALVRRAGKERGIRKRGE